MTNNFNDFSGDHTNEFDTQDIMDNKVVCVLAYIPVLFWLPLVFNARSRFGKFHANQALALLLYGIVTMIVVKVLGLLLGWIPILGAILVGLVEIALGITVLAFIIYGMVNTGNGNAKELPILGSLLHLISY